MKKKTLIFFRSLFRYQREKEAGTVHPEGLRNIEEDQKCANQIRQGLVKRSWTDIVFHHDAKKRLKQHRVHLHKRQSNLILT